jgi:hypothetical protein
MQPAASAGCRVPAPAGVLVVYHPKDPLPDGPERFGRGQTIHRPFDHLAFNLLLDAGDPDLEKSRPGWNRRCKKNLTRLQQRVALVERLVQHRA